MLLISTLLLIINCCILSVFRTNSFAISSSRFQRPTRNYWLEMKSQKVAVIGAGAAGLITADTLRQCGINVEIFEKNNYVGGIWKYTSKSAMYYSLVTNLPKQIMEIDKENPFSKSLPSFLTHHAVQEYLENFASSNSLLDVTTFSAMITNVRKTPDNKWSITYNKNNQSLSVDNFDAVAVCNGHYDVPYTPSLTGISNFRGEVIHSKDYNNPNKFEGKSILIVGGRSSATDLAREISQVAKEVYVSSTGLQSKKHENNNIHHRTVLNSVNEDGFIVFEDGEHILVDCIIWCTGYEFNYPFLNDMCLNTQTPLGELFSNYMENGQSKVYLEVSRDEFRSVRPLYQQLFHAMDPSLVFIGLPHSVIPFPLFRLQAKWMAAILLGDQQLPSIEERLQWLQLFEQNQIKVNWPPRKYHYLGEEQWDYCLTLARGAGIDDEDIRKYIEVNKQIYDDNSAHKPAYIGAPDTYRKREYIVDRQVIIMCLIEVLIFTSHLSLTLFHSRSSQTLVCGAV